MCIGVNFIKSKGLTLILRLNLSIFLLLEHPFGKRDSIGMCTFNHLSWQNEN